MKVLFIITSSEMGTWLSEVTHPYWHLSERRIDVDFASPLGGKVEWTPRSDPYYRESSEANDLVSKGFLSDPVLRGKLNVTKRLEGIDPKDYDAVHVAGGRGATFDLFPNEDVARALEHFWSAGKVVGAICHGAIALANSPDRSAVNALPRFHSRRTVSWRACSGAASSFHTIRKHLSKRWE
jgi:putative intracellular protease/amidase